MTISFGLTADELEFRRNSIGASDARIIVNGSDEDVSHLWRMKRGEIPAEDLDANIHCQFGQFVEGFHRHWFEMRTGLHLDQVGAEVHHPDYEGMHVTLDGFIGDLPPTTFPDPNGDFKFSWGCRRPSGPVNAIWEGKWRNGHVFNLPGQVATFAPQVHQAMALVEVEYAILSTFVSDLVIHARVMPFDQFYWAQCLMRIDDFREAVAGNRPPTRFPRLSAPEGIAEVAIIPRTVDMMRTGKANEWAAFAAMLKANSPTPAETARATNLGKAKTQLKGMLDKDIGIAKGAGIIAKRNKGGAVSFEVDAMEIEAARALAEVNEGKVA